MDKDTIDNTNHFDRDIDSVGADQEPVQMEGETITNPEDFQHQLLQELRPNDTTVESESNICICARDKVSDCGLSSDELAWCPLCGKAIATEQIGSMESGMQFTESTAPSTSGTEQSALLLSQDFARRLNFLPDTAETYFQGNRSSIGERVGSTTSLRQRTTVAEQAKTPVQGEWHFPTQMPPVPTLLNFFITVRPQAGTNGLLLALFFVTLGHFQEAPFNRWLSEHMPYIVPIGDELSSQEEYRPFHTANMQDHVDINFELVQQLHRQFRIANLPPINRVPLIRIMSLNEYRIPGPLYTLYVECLPAEPGELLPPQNHLRMALDFDGITIRKMTISIWFPRRTDQLNRMV